MIAKVSVMDVKDDNAAALKAKKNAYTFSHGSVQLHLVEQPGTSHVAPLCKTFSLDVRLYL